MDAIIKKCNCPDNGPAAKYQSEKYGPGMRVHTPAKDKIGSSVKPRCTVCSREN